MLYDVAAYQGPWPFGGLTDFSVRALLRMLQREGVTRAAVSPLAGVFQTDPMPVNRAFLRQARGQKTCEPVPVLNPSLANWPEQLAECVQLAPGLRAVRILPSYQGYDLNSPRLAAFVDALTEKGLRLLLTARLVDRRLACPAFRVDDLSVSTLATFLKRHPDVTPLIIGLTILEVRALARKGRAFFADIAFVEWLRSLETLGDAGLARHLMFSTNAPFFVPRATAAKLAAARLAPEDRDAIAFRNAERFLSG